MKTKMLDCPCCGRTPKVCQWKDTVNPNATWIECECGMMTDSQHDVSPQVAIDQAVAIWNGSRE